VQVLHAVEPFWSGCFCLGGCARREPRHHQCLSSSGWSVLAQVHLHCGL